MNQETQILFNCIEKGSTEERMNTLLDIGDSIEFGYYKGKVLPDVVQALVNLLPREKDVKTRKLIFRDISAAYMKKADLSSVEYDSVLDASRDAEPNFICNVLHLLAMTYNKKYIATASKYLNHPDEMVRREALAAYSSLQ